MRRWWVSWYSTGEQFELWCPWWVSGVRCSDDAETICAAVLAETREDAMQVVVNSHDTPPSDIEWRFVEERPDGWSPFGGRFPRSETHLGHREEEKEDCHPRDRALGVGRQLQAARPSWPGCHPPFPAN